MSAFKRSFLLFFIIIVILLLLFFLFYQNSEKSNLKVTFFDVGQGDSALIQTPYGQDIIIDGGPDNSVLSKLGDSLGFFDKDIELMILTHPHKDHLTGLIEIIKRYDVEKIMYTGVDYDSLVYDVFLEEAKNEGAEIIIVNKKQKILLGDNMYLDILFPKSDITNVAEENVNNTSIISRLVYGKESFLFMGDAEKEEESEIINNKNIESTVLKIAHHGSKTNDKEFLRVVSPEYTVVSLAKDNKFGHPDAGTINILEKIQSKILRTDQEGDIYFISDGVFIKSYY